VAQKVQKGWRGRHPSSTKRVAQKARKGGAEGTKRMAQKIQKGWRTRDPSTVREYEREGEREFAPLRGDSPPGPRPRILSPELPEDRDGTATQHGPGQPDSTATQRQSSGTAGKPDRDGSNTTTQRVSNPGPTWHQPRR